MPDFVSGAYHTGDSQHKGFPKPFSSYKLVGTYNDLVKAGKVVLEERDGLHVLVRSHQAGSI
jgi:hypothetical protein